MTTMSNNHHGVGGANTNVINSSKIVLPQTMPGLGVPNLNTATLAKNNNSIILDKNTASDTLIQIPQMGSTMVHQ